MPGLERAEWTGTAGGDWLVELSSEEDVTTFTPEQSAIAALGLRAMIITARAAPTSAYDFVSRVFAPNVGVAEDPVTGSAHCALAPYWAERLGRDDLTGYQTSARGGTVRVRLDQGDVVMFGQAVTMATVELAA